MTGEAPKIHVYIDETGDRGSGRDSSPIFGMAAIVVDDRGAQEVRTAISRLRADFRVPSGTVMSWKRHVKSHDRRRRAVELLSAVQGLKVCYVYADKKQLWDHTYRDDPSRFYNYVALKTYTSTLWAARNWKGDRARVWTRFGHVRRHDHRATESYLRATTVADARVPDWMEQGLRWVSADQYLESQAADLYGGFLKAALWPDGDFGYTEPSYLLNVWHQIRNSENCAIPLGLMSMPDSALVTRHAWFPCDDCSAKTDGPSGASRGRSTEGGR